MTALAAVWLTDSLNALDQQVRVHESWIALETLRILCVIFCDCCHAISPGWLVSIRLNQIVLLGAWAIHWCSYGTYSNLQRWKPKRRISNNHRHHNHSRPAIAQNVVSRDTSIHESRTHRLLLLLLPFAAIQWSSLWPLILAAISLYLVPLVPPHQAILHQSMLSRYVPGILVVARLHSSFTWSWSIILFLALSLLNFLTSLSNFRRFQSHLSRLGGASFIDFLTLFIHAITVPS